MSRAGSHVFTVRFHIAGATEAGDHSVRAYEDPRLQDQGLSLPIECNGIFEAEFEREAPTFSQAVLSALDDLQHVFPEADLLGVEPDELATIQAIAERTGRSHESVRLLIQGKRGPGGFPEPAGTLGGTSQVWRWHEVVQWFDEKFGEPVPETENAAFLAMINDLLRLRLAVPKVIDNRETAAALAALLPKQLTDPAAA